jgi:pimeloyl-ACP methyl ester carboxylesterase
MQHVISADGTKIAYERTGNGPPLILVHGAASDHTRWTTLVEHISDRFTLYNLDRRGRGESGDADNYAMAREFEDIVALAHSIPGPVDVYGHSSGALYSLEAARMIQNLRRLMLYEPVFPEDEAFTPSAVIDELQRLVDANRREDAVVLFMRDVAKFPEHEIERYKSLPTWAARVAAAHTFPRELRGAEEYRFQPDRFSSLNVPTLLLVGTESPAMFKRSIELLKSTLPNNRVHELDGQGHAADALAPELVAEALIGFLGSES